MGELLFEIGTEELPAGFLNPARDQLKLLFEKKAGTLHLPFGEINTFCTPRRLAIFVRDLADSQKDTREVLLGPSKKAAYDRDGRPTKAAEGFARSKGAALADLELVDTPKGEYLQLKRELKGQQTQELLPSLLLELVIELPFAKSMKWGNHQTTFARPVQWLLALFNDRIVAFEHEGIMTGDQTKGHRFMAPGFVRVAKSIDYEQLLKERSVIADFEKRKQDVINEVRRVVETAGFPEPAHAAIDEGLLNTVTNLVEKAHGVCGRFDEKFLTLPDEVLITSMREHQKYFPIVNNHNELLPGSVAVNNTDVKDYRLTREGHERVLRARLEDGLFFFESDKKIRLEERIDRLSGIVFQNRLGSMKEKTDRIVTLAGILSEMAAPEIGEDVCRAARLCKADLITDMVGEFPSLQGVMGWAYALNDGEKEMVAMAIREHYMPLRADAQLPTTDMGAIVGLADRIDTIAGCFGIGQQPTGTADPFGLRRLSLAVLHLIEDRGYELQLPEIIGKALALYGDRVDGGAETVATILSFMKGRFGNDCVARGMDAAAVEAVISVVFTDINDCLKRIEALAGMKQDESFELLAGSFKRIRNIVKEHDRMQVDEQLFVEEAERELWNAYETIERQNEEALAESDYTGVLKKMVTLKEPVDRFFADVMVMAEDETVRTNRLNMLAAIGSHILKVGDISKMHAGT
ncbi:MAG: glycine--tRNA ligase subunit beta [Proteobacteria bacterium]|nr:MAG: glycine--tRNA ligase subunit beta [Pseudomonadota bacterium]